MSFKISDESFRWPLSAYQSGHCFGTRSAALSSTARSAGDLMAGRVKSHNLTTPEPPSPAPLVSAGDLMAGRVKSPNLPLRKNGLSFSKAVARHELSCWRFPAGHDSPADCCPPADTVPVYVSWGYFLCEYTKTSRQGMLLLRAPRDKSAGAHVLLETKRHVIWGLGLPVATEGQVSRGSTI